MVGPDGFVAVQTDTPDHSIHHSNGNFLVGIVAFKMLDIKDKIG
jgi:hypothetical protein